MFIHAVVGHKTRTLNIPCHCSPDLYKVVAEMQQWTLKPVFTHRAAQDKILKNQLGSSIWELGEPLKTFFFFNMWWQQWQWVETVVVHLYVLPNSYVRSSMLPNLYMCLSLLPTMYVRLYVLPNSYVPLSGLEYLYVRFYLPSSAPILVCARTCISSQNCLCAYMCAFLAPSSYM